MEEVGNERPANDEARLLVALWPVGLAIVVFGAVFGTLARPLIGTPLTLLASALIFSGALQFTVAGLLLAGAGAPTLILAALTLNVRHLLLGAVLRARTDNTSALRRAGLAWFLVDEAVGLALTREDAGGTLVRAGLVCYISWLAGTAAGIAGGSVEAVQSAAGAVFPVLFIGLAAVSCRKSNHVVRAIAAAALTFAVALTWPGGRALAPVFAAIAVALPGGDR